MIYLDNNATTQPSPAVVEAVARALAEFWANPSSVHRPGQAVRQQIELARRDVAALVNAKPREVTFCSGGTEAINLVLRGVLAARTSTPRAEPPGPSPAPTAVPSASPAILTTKLEHAAVRDLVDELAKSGHAEVRWAPVDREGVVLVDALEALLPGCAVASIQWANNETGAIQPVAEIASRCRAARVPLHVDATQWIGKMPADLPALGADYATFAPHKFHGPKGVGAVWARPGARLRPLQLGTQELGRRGGTENVPGILGAGVAAREAAAWLADPAPRQALAALRDRFEAAVLAAVPDATVNGPRHPDRRLWNTTNLGFPRLEAEALMLILSERGLCASAGAACSSGSLDPSPVLLAMGVPPEIAHGSLRFSLSRHTTPAEVDRAAAIVIESVARLRAALPLTA